MLHQEKCPHCDAINEYYDKNLIVSPEIDNEVQIKLDQLIDLPTLEKHRSSS